MRDDDPQPEAFMVWRTHRTDFAEGALVFPGGELDANDRDPEWASRCRDAARDPEKAGGETWMQIPENAGYEAARAAIASRVGGDAGRPSVSVVAAEANK